MACTFPMSTESPSAWLDAINLARYKPTLEKMGVTEVQHLYALTEESLQAGGIAMRVVTTKPGVQLYTGGCAETDCMHTCTRACTHVSGVRKVRKRGEESNEQREARYD